MKPNTSYFIRLLYEARNAHFYILLLGQLLLHEAHTAHFMIDWFIVISLINDTK